MTALLVAIILVFLFGGAVLFLRTVWFHRDPLHPDVPQRADAVRSPVYGIVAYVRRVEDGIVTADKKGEEIPLPELTKDQSGQSGWLVGIAMTALDVHFQYAPVPAVVESMHHHRTGRNLPMFDLWEYVRITWFRRWVSLWAKRYLLENERMTFRLRGASVTLSLVLIADKFVDKITPFVKAGDEVAAGAKLSFIGRGSQVDVFLPDTPGLQIAVQPGDRALGPRTVIAHVRAPESDAAAEAQSTAEPLVR
ncbi:MAG: phosphatidylserine decarboxylase [Armatimonadota bacterium]